MSGEWAERRAHLRDILRELGGDVGGERRRVEELDQLLVGGRLERGLAHLVLVEEAVEDLGREHEAVGHRDPELGDDGLQPKLVAHAVEEAEAAPLAAQGPLAVPHHRRVEVGDPPRRRVLHAARQLVSVGARLGQDPVSQPVGALVAVGVDEVVRVRGGAEALGELELGAREEPLREVGVAAVVRDRLEGELRPRLDQLGHLRGDAGCEMWGVT